jgi:hypothetical protein
VLINAWAHAGIKKEGEMRHKEKRREGREAGREREKTNIFMRNTGEGPTRK